MLASVFTQHDVALVHLVLVFLLKVLLLLLGYLVVKLGYRLLDSGVKGEFKFQAAWSGLKADLASASPGLLFLLLGVFLMAYALGVSKIAEIQSDGPVDLSPPSVPLPEPGTSLPEISDED